MEHIIIDKLFKKPSLFASAKHYRIELISNTLYLLEMSKARPQTHLSKHSLNGAIANKMLDNYEIKFAQQYEISLQNLSAIGIKEFSKRKNCYAIEHVNAQNIELDNLYKKCIVNAQGKKIKLFIYDAEKFEKLIQLVNQLNK